jgi:HEAT repeat protein
MKNQILKILRGGDLRSIGEAEEAARRVSGDRRLFGDLFAGLFDPDRLVRMRAADAIEKATRIHPDWLDPWKTCLLEDIANRDEKEMRWHVAQMLPRLKLTSSEKRQAILILTDYLRDKSSLVRTFSMQALADLAAHDALLRAEVLPIIERLTRTGTPAMRARGRKLLIELNHYPRR